MQLSLRKLRINVTAGLILSTFLIAFAGCGLQRAPLAGKKAKSWNQMKALITGIILYRDSNDNEWPEELAQARELLEGDHLDFDELMHNPVTGDNPGYEYVKPPPDADPKTTVILYQLREGRRDTTLRVGFADGHVSTSGSQE